MREFIICIGIKEDMTSQEHIDFVKGWSFSYEDFLKFIRSTVYDSPLAQKVTSFLMEYDNGFLCPDKYNLIEPVNKPFDKEAMIRIIADPGSWILLKKVKVFSTSFVLNASNDYGVCFEGKNHKLCVRSPMPKKYLTKIHMRAWEKNISYEKSISIINDFCKYFSTDYGVLIDSNTEDVLYQYDPSVPVYKWFLGEK